MDLGGSQRWCLPTKKGLQEESNGERFELFKQKKSNIPKSMGVVGPLDRDPHPIILFFCTSWPPTGGGARFCPSALAAHGPGLAAWPQDWQFESGKAAGAASLMHNNCGPW